MTISGKHELDKHAFDFSELPPMPKWMSVSANNDNWNKPVFNNKPSWDSAPSWAMWLAMDADGDWYWYSNEPIQLQSNRIWKNNATGRFLAAGVITHGIKRMTDWEDSLEARPEHAEE